MGGATGWRSEADLGRLRGRRVLMSPRGREAETVGVRVMTQQATRGAHGARTLQLHCRILSLSATSSWVECRSSRHILHAPSSYPGPACGRPQKPDHRTAWDIAGCAHEREHAARISRTCIVMHRLSLLPNRGLALQDSSPPHRPFKHGLSHHPDIEQPATGMSQQIEASLRFDVPFPRPQPSPVPDPRSLLSAHMIPPCMPNTALWATLQSTSPRV